MSGAVHLRHPPTAAVILGPPCCEYLLIGLQERRGKSILAGCSSDCLLPPQAHIDEQPLHYCRDTNAVRVSPSFPCW